MDNYIYIVVGIIILLIIINVALTYEKNRPPNLIGLSLNEAIMEIEASEKNYILGIKIGFVEPERGKFQLLGKIAEQYPVLQESNDPNAPIQINYKLYQIDTTKFEPSIKEKSPHEIEMEQKERLEKQKREMEQKQKQSERQRERQKEMERIQLEKREMEKRELEQRELEQKELEQRELDQRESRFNRNNKNLSLLMSIPMKPKSKSNLNTSYKKVGNLDIVVPDVENNVNQHSKNKSFFW